MDQNTNANETRNEIIIVLGTQIPEDGVMPNDLKNRLDAVVSHYRQHPYLRIIACGKHALCLEKQDNDPAHYECRIMKSYLVNHGVKSSKVIMESRSKNTIGNAYYSKRIVQKLGAIDTLVIVCASQHQPRVKYIFTKIFGHEYNFNFLTLEASQVPAFTESETREMELSLGNKGLLPDMDAGDDSKLKHKLYKSKFYIDYFNNLPQPS